MAHTSWNRAGRCSVPPERATVTSPSSRGWRRASSTSRWNSGSSSRNSTPLWAREISPGRSSGPPPARAAAEAVWWGARKGRRVSRGRFGSVSPATDQMPETASASSRLMSGRMEGSRFASMDLPAPGEPIISRLWPPAAAISRARFTFSWPITSRRSGMGTSSSAGVHAGAGERGACPRRWPTRAPTSVTP